MKKHIKFLVIVFSVLLVACSDKDETLSAAQILNEQLKQVDQAQLHADTLVIDEYLDTNSIQDVLTEPNGIRYKIEVLGTGPKPTLEGAARVTYKGKLMSNHSVFDQGANVGFPIAGLIIGWKISLPLLPEGTKAILYIPSVYCYGAAGYPPVIPENANLIFEIQLLETIE